MVVACFACEWTYHLGIEECIVESWIRFEELASKESCVLDIFEEGDLDGIGFVVWEFEGAY